MIHKQIIKINSNTTLKIVIKPERREQEKKGRKKNNKNKSKAINKMAIRTYISIITLNVNGLNAPTKRHRLAEWIQKQDLEFLSWHSGLQIRLGTMRVWVRSLALLSGLRIHELWCRSQARLGFCIAVASV